MNKLWTNMMAAWMCVAVCVLCPWLVPGVSGKNVVLQRTDTHELSDSASQQLEAGTKPGVSDERFAGHRSPRHRFFYPSLEKLASWESESLQDFNLVSANQTRWKQASSGFGSPRPGFKPEYLCPWPEPITEHYRPCGDDLCRCRHGTADCSGTNMTYVPKLPDDISTLNFAHNGLTAIDENFLQNVSDISALYFHENSISSIHPAAFRSLRKLTELRLEHNKLTYAALAPALSVTTLTFLNIEVNPLGPPPEDLFYRYPLPHLQAACMGGLGLASLNMSLFAPLAKMTYLDLVDNRLSEDTFVPAYLPSLETLIIMANSFFNVPETCSGSGPYFPNLVWLDMSHNNYRIQPATSVCLPRLQLFVCLFCTLPKIPANAFGTNVFPSLKSVHLGINPDHRMTIEDHAFNNTVLEQIFLEDSDIDFSKDYIHPDCFAGCPHLKTLYLSGNDLGSVTEHKLQRLFNHSRLMYLTLKYTGIEQISSAMFANLPRVSVLWLGYNKLTSVPDGAFDGMEHLELLELSVNRIASITESTFSPATRKRLQHVILGGNPFHCDCSLRFFQRWLNADPILFKKCHVSEWPCHKYMCDNLPNTTVQSFYVADQICVWSPAVSKFIIASFVLLMLPLAVGILFYRYRWHIRLMLYEAARGRTDTWRSSLREHHFRYDVFVCYDSRDISWVRSHLMRELEGRLRLRLCIHQRDFTLGAPIVQNIEESVQSSRKTLVVFSRNFARSQWCQLELQLCLSHVLEHGGFLIVVLLEDIPSRDLTPAMTAVMKTVTYIEWRNEPAARAAFWARIRHGLNESFV